MNVLHGKGKIDISENSFLFWEIQSAHLTDTIQGDTRYSTLARIAQGPV